MKTITIFVDADACPRVIKDVIIRASMRTGTPVVFIANKPIALPISELFTSVQVSRGFDMADEKIVDAVEPGDICITADIPLADAVLEKGARAINPRGFQYTDENIKDMLITRDLKEELRDFGVMSKGPKGFLEKDKRNFANVLDKLLAQACGNKKGAL